MDEHSKEHLHETPWVVTGPLILLAIPSVVIGWMTIQPILFGDYFGSAIYVAEDQDVVGTLGKDFHGPLGFVLHAFTAFATPSVYLAAAGAGVAWFLDSSNSPCLTFNSRSRCWRFSRKTGMWPVSR